MRPHRAMKLSLAAALCAGLLLAMAPARAGETLAAGTVGSPNAIPWPYYIADSKGFFTDEGLTVDLIYAQSNAAVLQALTAGSITLAVGAGLADPVHAVGQGAAVAVVRIEGRVGPYALLANSRIKSVKALKGRRISVDEPTGTTLAYLDEILAGNGLSQNCCDMIYAGATAARFAALEAGASDAAMLAPPFNFRAEAAGFVTLAHDVDYAKDLPFNGTIVYRPWAAQHKDMVQKFIRAYGRAIAFFDADRNRAEAIDILVKVSKQDPGDIAKAYDYFRKIGFFEPSGKVSLKALANVTRALQGMGDKNANVDVRRLIMPGVTQVAD